MKCSITNMKENEIIYRYITLKYYYFITDNYEKG